MGDEMQVCENCLSAPASCEIGKAPLAKTESRRFYCGPCFSSPDRPHTVEDRLVAVYRGEQLILTRQQIRRITFLLHAVWKSDDDPDEDEVVEDMDLFQEQLFPQALAEVETPEELHYYAMNFNWDDDLAYLRSVIHHPLCDQGTALMLFWLGQPDLLYGWEAEGKIMSLHDDGLSFVKEIQAEYLRSGFPNRRIRVDPTNMVPGVDYTKPDAGSTGMHLIPEAMKRASPGKPLDYVSV